MVCQKGKEQKQTTDYRLCSVVVVFSQIASYECVVVRKKRNQAERRVKRARKAVRERVDQKI